MQENYLDSIQVFPHFAEYLPDTIETFRNSFKEEPKKSDTVKTNLYAGDNYEYLQNFFTKLTELEKDKKKVVRVLHYGDSMLWSDMITSEIRTKFQKDFGDGGRGLVPITNQISRKVLAHKNLTNESQFTWKNLDHRQFINPQIGFLGEAAIPNYSQVIMRHELDSDKLWRDAKLIFRTTQDITQIKTKAGFKTNIDSLQTLSAESKVKDGCAEIGIPLGESKSLQLEITGLNGNTVFDAIQFETEGGVSYSTVSRQGIEISDLLLIDKKSMSCGFTYYKPDLIVFQFGVNESENLARHAFITPEKYEKDLEDVIRLYQEILPDSNILLISPIERISKDSKGIYQTMPEILLIRDKQKEIAAKYKVAFFDSFTALGGAGQNDTLYENGFMQPDRTHLNRKGGEFFAEIFYSDLYTHFKKFNGILEDVHKANLANLKKEKNKEVNFISKAYFYFFLAVWIVSAVLTRYPELKIGFLAIVSFYFYSTWNFYALFIILISTFIDYFCGLKIYSEQQKGKKGSGYLLLSLTSNLSILFFFKYYDFVASLLNGNLVNGSPIQIPLLHLILPVGISFYTFQTLSYTIDIWRGVLVPETKIMRFAEYVAFFPQLVAGPIVRATEFLPGLKNRGEHFYFRIDEFSHGVWQILIGIIKKILADRLAVGIVDGVYSNPDMYTSVEILTAIYAYGVQIYFDFSGYSDIAIGSARILGYNLTLNFNRPYTSFSINDFWRKWHISLGSWFRDYLYIPLGGNKAFVYRNLLLTFILCGIWHGAGIPFLLWGFYHGLLLVAERIFRVDRFQNRFMRAVTLHFVLIGWIIFRSDSWLTFNKVIQNLFAMNLQIHNLEIWILYFLIFYYLYEWIGLNVLEKLKMLWCKSPLVVQGFLAGITILISYYLHQVEVKPFIYFQF